jgi:type IV pilus assembly protein PilN
MLARLRRISRGSWAIASGALAAGVLFAVGVGLQLGSIQDEQDVRNRYLKSEIAKLDKEIDEIKALKDMVAALLARKQVIDVLQADRSGTVRLLDMLARQAPEGVVLRSASLEGARLSLTGSTRSHAWVAVFMRNLESTPHTRGVLLNGIKASAPRDDAPYDFGLVVYLKRAAMTRTGGKPAPKPSSMDYAPVFLADEPHPGDPK